jgi:hypothetical protein
MKILKNPCRIKTYVLAFCERKNHENWGSKATPIFLAAPQSTHVFFGTLLFSSALATAAPNNLAMPNSTPIYWGRKATPIFLATPQSTLVFFCT